MFVVDENLAAGAACGKQCWEQSSSVVLAPVEVLSDDIPLLLSCSSFHPQDDRTIGSEEAVYIESLKQDLEGVLSGLSARDAGVLRMRFGLTDGREYTLDEVGAEFHVSGMQMHLDTAAVL